MIKGEHIQLRLIRSTDLLELFDKWHDPDIRGPFYPVSFIPEPKFHEMFSKTGFWTDESQRLLITDLADKMLGLLHCSKQSSFSDSVELSYILFDPSKRNKSYTTEAVILFVDYFFNNRRGNRIQISIPQGNEASIRVAEKAGFIHEGVARGAFFLNGEDIDIQVYSMLRKEWQLMTK